MNNATRRKSVDDHAVTGAGEITTRQSIIPVRRLPELSLARLTSTGIACHHPLLHVGVRLRPSRCSKQALPRDTSCHCCTVLRSSSVCTSTLYQAPVSHKYSAYFGAYFVGPLTYSGWIVRKFGYRWTFITGLCIYGVGALLFWPSGVKRSFGGFCGAMFVVGSGLSTLETSANPFIVSVQIRS